jgi:hypothetical protein
MEIPVTNIKVLSLKVKGLIRAKLVLNVRPNAQASILNILEIN